MMDEGFCGLGSKRAREGKWQRRVGSAIIPTDRTAVGLECRCDDGPAAKH